jgi:hypothetical protein
MAKLKRGFGVFRISSRGDFRDIILVRITSRGDPGADHVFVEAVRELAGSEAPRIGVRLPQPEPRDYEPAAGRSASSLQPTPFRSP